MNRKKIWLMAGAMGAALLADTAYAQSSDVDALVVTARKREESVQDVPLSITAMSGETLKEVRLADVRDLTRFVPNLSIVSAGSERTAVFVTIRGQSAADVILTTDSSVGLYMDGVNIPRNFGLSDGLIDLERVEVLKGPQGTLYGRNTTGGAISFVTRAPSMQGPGGFGTLELGTFNRVDLTAAIDIPVVEDTLAFRVLARRTTQDGTGQNANGQDVNNEDNQYYRVRGVWEPTDSFRADLTADYTRASSNGQAVQILSLNGFPPRPGLPSPTNALVEIAVESGLAPTPANLAAAQGIWQQYLRGPGPAGSDFSDSGSGLDQSSLVEMASAGLSLTYDINDSWQIKSTTGFRHFIKQSYFDLDGTPFAILHPRQAADSDFSSEELQLSYSGDRTTAIFGAFVSRETGREEGRTIALASINPNNPNRNTGDVRNKSWAIYGQGDYEFTDRLTLTVGLRWTEEDKELVNRNAAGTPAVCAVPVALRDSPLVCAATFDDKFSDYSYLVSLEYQPTDDLMFYARTARGFRGGGQNLRGAGDPLTFSSFQPEVATDFEVGMKAEFLDHRVRFNAAAYQTNYSDIQRSIFVLNPATSAVVTLVENAAKATIKGVEADWTFRVTDDFTLSGTAAYIDAGYDEFSDASGDRSSEPFAVPKWTYSLSARYARPTSFGKIVSRLDYSWQDDQVLRPSAKIDADVTQPAYGILSGQVAFEIDAWDATVAVFGRNLTDEEYIIGAVDLDASLGWNVGFQGAPRTVGVSFTKRWGGG